jgi:hypothetical protein
LDGECNLGDSFSKSGKVLVKTNTLTNSIEWGSQSLIVDNIKLRDTLVCSDESVAAVLKLQGNFDYNSKFKAKLFNKDKTKSYDIRMLFSNNSNDFFGLVLHELPIIESGKYYFKVSSENPIAESDFLGINISALPTFTVSTIPYFPSSDTVKLTKKDSLIFKVDITGEGPWEFNFWHKDYKASQTPFYFTDSDIKISEQPNLLWEFPPPVGFTNSGLCANKNGRSFPENLYIILLDSLITPPDKIDLSLSSSFEKKSVEKDGINQLKITLKNDGKTEATNIKVKLNIPYSPPFIMKEGQKCSNGSFDSNIWSIPSLTEGDSCVLYIDYKPVQDGVWYVEAEVMSTDQEDEDSKPNNQSQSEDDFTRNCFSIPIKFASEPFGMQLIVQDSKMDVTSWYKNGIKLNNSGNTLQITQFGTYSYEAKDFICPTQGCCPFIIEKGNDTNCCKPLEYILKN